MDTKQLRYFLTIVEEGQITKAAQKLHMAQPPLSSQLKLLEKELGVTLIKRKRRSNLELTKAGEALYNRGKKLMNELEDTITEVKETNEGLRGTLSIGSTKSCFSFLPKRIKYFRKKYPAVNFQILEGDSYIVSKYLTNKEIEVAVVRLPVDETHLSMIKLPKEPYVAVVPNDWDLSEHTSIKLKEFKNLPLLLLHRVSGIGQYEMIVEECKQHGFEPMVVCECPDASMLLSLVSSGIGASIVPKSTIATVDTNGYKVFELEDSTITTEAAIVWLKGRYLSKSAVEFIETFKDDSVLSLS